MSPPNVIFQVGHYVFRDDFTVVLSPGGSKHTPWRINDGRIELMGPTGWKQATGDHWITLGNEFQEAYETYINKLILEQL